MVERVRRTCRRGRHPAGTKHGFVFRFHPGGPRSVAAAWKDGSCIVSLESHGLGPDGAGPFRRNQNDAIPQPAGRVRRTRRRGRSPTGAVQDETPRQPCAFPRPFPYPARSANAPYHCPIGGTGLVGVICGRTGCTVHYGAGICTFTRKKRLDGVWESHSSSIDCLPWMT